MLKFSEAMKLLEKEGKKKQKMEENKKKRMIGRKNPEEKNGKRKVDTERLL